MSLDFSIVKGGPFYWIGQRLGLADGPWGLFQRALILAALTWVPLLLLNLLRGHVNGDPSVTFAWSLGTHTRLLVAIPLFFAAEATFDTQTRAALGHLIRAQVVPPVERPRLDRALRDTMRLRDSVLACSGGSPGSVSTSCRRTRIWPAGSAASASLTPTWLR